MKSQIENSPAPGNLETGSRAWRTTLLLALAALAARVLYLAWLCPYELVGDEAQYWDWSRPAHLDICYYSKGPGVAWLIAASTRLLGSSEWTVRLPAAVASFLATLVIARLATFLSHGNARVGLYAAVLFMLTPVYLAVGFLMTIDGPFLLCWLLALWAGARAFAALEKGRSSLPAWLGLGLALGVGCLFKYTILLMLPGLLWFAVLRRRSWKNASPGRVAVHVLLGLMLFLSCLTPVVVWNQARGWPTVAHLFGNVNLPGGDWGVVEKRPWWGPILWPLELLGTQIALIGPALLVCFLGYRHARNQRWHEGALWPGRLLLLCTALPILAFYLALSFTHAVEGNWPIAGYAGLLILAAQTAVVELPRWRQQVRDWRALPTKDRPRAGFLRRKPETLFQMGWHWAIGYGIGALVLFVSLFHLANVPGVGAVVPRFRFHGYRELGQRVERALPRAREAAKVKPEQPLMIVTDTYGLAAQLAFYMPSRPTVFSAAHRLNPQARKSSYDYFADTSFDDPALVGRALVIVDLGTEHYQKAFRLGKPIVLDPPGNQASTAAPEDRLGNLRIYVAPNYRGPMPRTSTGK